MLFVGLCLVIIIGKISIVVKGKDNCYVEYNHVFPLVSKTIMRLFSQ